MKSLKNILAILAIATSAVAATTPAFASQPGANFQLGEQAGVNVVSIWTDGYQIRFQNQSALLLHVNYVVYSGGMCFERQINLAPYGSGIDIPGVYVNMATIQSEFPL